MLTLGVIAAASAGMAAVSAAVAKVVITVYALKGVPPNERPAIIRALSPLLSIRK